MGGKDGLPHFSGWGGATLAEFTPGENILLGGGIDLMVTHIALFKMVHANKEIIEEARKALEALGGKIPQLRHFEVGVNIVYSYRSYDLALVATFDSLEDLQIYQNDPNYVEVVKYLQGVRQSVVTVDYETP
jgi:hypothetical protein